MADKNLNGGNKGEGVVIYTHKDIKPGDKMDVQTPQGTQVGTVVQDVSPSWLKGGKYVKVKLPK